jgi:hypothetical protein
LNAAFVADRLAALEDGALGDSEQAKALVHAAQALAGVDALVDAARRLAHPRR